MNTHHFGIVCERSEWIFGMCFSYRSTPAWITPFFDIHYFACIVSIIFFAMANALMFARRKNVYCPFLWRNDHIRWCIPNAFAFLYMARKHFYSCVACDWFWSIYVVCISLAMNLNYFDATVRFLWQFRKNVFLEFINLSHQLLNLGTYWIKTFFLSLRSLCVILRIFNVAIRCKTNAPDIIGIWSI